MPAAGGRGAWRGRSGWGGWGLRGGREGLCARPLRGSVRVPSATRGEGHWRAAKTSVAPICRDLIRFMPVIPAPALVTPRPGSFGLAPLVTVGYAQAGLGTAAARFAAELARRTGSRACAVPGSDGDIVVDLGDSPERAGLTAPLGLDPGTGDESHVITIGPDRVTVLAAAPPGAERAFATLLQLAATCDDATLPAQQIIDAPRLGWRGLSLDVVRRYFPPEAIRRVIDLLALYKLNVLHLHLTDDEGWRIEPGRPAAAREPDGSFYSNDELRDLVSYAAQRCVTIVPEVDTPGHVAALVKLRTELRTSRNLVRQAGAQGTEFRTAWLDPEQPATFGVIGEVFAELSSVIPGAFIHIGGDEAWQMPDNAYRAYLGQLLPMIRELGRLPIGWQEIIRADPGQAAAIQFWMSPASFEQLNTSELPAEIAALVTENGRRTRSDAARAIERGVPVIMSPSAHCYLDVPYAEEPADPAKAGLRDRLGLRNYRAQTLRESFDWIPAAELGADVGGVEAAIWCETVRDFDDLTFLLLPRLPGVAERAWSGGHGANWARHSAALGAQARLWDQDRLTYFSPAGPAPPPPHVGSMAH